MANGIAKNIAYIVDASHSELSNVTLSVLHVIITSGDNK